MQHTTYLQNERKTELRVQLLSVNSSLKNVSPDEENFFYLTDIVTKVDFGQLTSICQWGQATETLLRCSVSASYSSGLVWGAAWSAASLVSSPDHANHSWRTLRGD